MDGKIILMHDIHKRTFNALKKIHEIEGSGELGNRELYLP